MRVQTDPQAATLDAKTTAPELVDRLSGDAILSRMRSASARVLLRLLGGLFAAIGFVAWMGLAWTGISELDTVSAESEEAGTLMFWALSGTILMIVGMILLHVADD